MLLQQIVEKLDQELGRLYQLREIVAGLAHGPRLEFPGNEAVDTTIAIEPAAPPVKEAAAQPKGRVRRSFGRRTQEPRQRSAAEKAHTALASAIPAGPVVVSAAVVANQIAEKQKAREAARPVEQGTLGAMIRALGQQGAL
jgi:hypothetical protein